MGKNKIGMILIIILLVALLLLFGVGFWLLYTTVQKGNSDESTTAMVQEVTIDRKNIAIFNIGESAITTNLLEGPDGKKHVIKIRVNLGINNSKDVQKEATALMELLTEQTVFLEDTILGICRNKTYEELTRNDAQSILADEIKMKIADAFDTKLILEVIINELIVD